MEKLLNSNIRSTYGFGFVMLMAVCIVLTYGCSAQKDAKSDVKTGTVVIAANSVNINTATADELEKLPHIGEKLAKDIIEYRETYGRFRKPEHLMLIRGISDKKFRAIRSFVRTE